MTDASPVQETQAQQFLALHAKACLDEPALAARAVVPGPLGDAAASEAVGHAIRAARAALPQSQAALLFDVLNISSPDALLASLHRAFGPKAVQALKDDAAAMAKMPARSECALAAWRFPDGSCVLSAKAVDGSFHAMGAAIDASPAFRAALGPGGDAAMERARAASWGSDSASAIDHDDLRRLIGSLARAPQQWQPGVSFATRTTSRSIEPQFLLDALDEVPLASSLDAALANALGKPDPESFDIAPRAS
jgi:hypothetical protein